MKIQIQGIEELPSKSNELVKSVSKLLTRVDPDLSYSLLKALPKKDELFTDPVQLELLKQWELGYRKQVDQMIADIEKVIDGKPIFKSLDEGISYFKFDPNIQDYVEESNEDLNKGGPYIGPRGGKWADPDHTIPWKEELHSAGTKERYSDEEAEEKINAIGEALLNHQASNPYEKDDAGFSSADMGNWRYATSLLSKRAILRKYRRQISDGWGVDEYHKLGLSDNVSHKSEIKPYYDKTWGSLMLPVDGRISREAFDKFRSINKKHNVWFSNGSNFVKEQYLDDFDFEGYKKELSEIGIFVHPIKGERKSKVEDKESKDLTVDEALELIKRRKAKDTIVLKKIGKDKFAFWSTFSTEFNDLFSNKRGGLSGIFNANKVNNWARETHELSLVEEAIEKIKERMPKFNLVIDEKGLKEAQIERDNYQAELRKPIPGVQEKMNPQFSMFLYQNEGVRFLDKTNGNALIGDEMGLGKSLQTLAWVAKGNHRTIVVAPKVVRRTWLQEAEKFFPGHFKGVELISADIRNNRVPDLKDKNIVTVNYESLEKFYPYLKDAGFDTVVVDESHRMKNPKAKQTQAIQKIAKEVKHHILLSGTAIKNKKEELFTQIELVAPGKFKNKNDIKFATIGGLWQDMKDFYIAHRKIDVLKDLPEKTTTIMNQEIPGLPDYNGKKDIGDVARLKAAIAIGKAPSTVDLASEILDSSDSKVIVFTDSVEAAKSIAEKLGDKAILHHGQMSDDKRESVKSEFQRQDKQGNFISDKRVFVTTRQSMAVGATLTAADKVIFNDLPWTAADLRQAEDRAHRIGQKNNVNVYWNTADNNVFDSTVSAIVMQKYELSKKVNQGKKLTDEEIAWMEKPVSVQEVLAKIHGGGDLVEERDKPVKEDKPTPVIPLEHKDAEAPITREAPKVEKPVVVKEKPVKPEVGSKSNPQNAIDQYKDKQVEKINESYESLKYEFNEAKKVSGVTGIEYEEPHTKHLEKVYQNALSHNLDRVVIARAKNDWMESRLKDLRDYIKRPRIPVLDITTGKPIEPKKEETKLIIPAEQPVKKKRGRLPKVRTSEEIAEMNKPKRRGRPPGSKNKTKKIERVPVKSETTEKPTIGRPPKSEEQKATEAGLSLVSANKVKLKKLKSDNTHDIYKPNIVLDEDDAKIVMRNLRDRGINVIIIPGENGVIKIRKGFEMDGFVDQLEKALGDYRIWK